MSALGNDHIFKAILGPTNTGKTHYAVERMLARSSGVIGLPLRLLAREIYDRIVAQKGAAQCALVTGEEKIIPKHARYFVCTVEAMPVEKRFAFLAVDEVQLMANHERGHIFTDRVLHARGTEETLFLGAETIRPVLHALCPDIRFEHRDRFSVLSYAGETKLTRLPKRSVVVAFSTEEVYTIAELIRRYRGGAAVVMGGLSPRTRNAQAAMFQSGEVDFLVATDAVGMGLNLDTDHVAFAGLQKFDGRRRRYLTPMEAAQIAGRAGRFRNNGTFGTTGQCLPMDPDMIERIENHRFEPVQIVEWRNSDLDLSSIETLFESLNVPRPHKRLKRIKGAIDEAALERLVAIDEISNNIHSREDVKRLWDVCQIPDFRNLTIDAHVRLLQDIYRILVANNGVIPDDFMQTRIDRLDDMIGGVGALSSRLAHIRTWSYCAAKSPWMRDEKKWVIRAREVEDRLSDALHESLIERFVDRRTNKLLKGIGADNHMSATIKDNGEVWADEILIGRLEGLKFTIDESGSEIEAKALEAAAEKVVGPEVDRRLTSLCGGTHAIFTLSDTGQILWGGNPVGKIAASGSVFNPDAELIGAERGTETLKQLAVNRMRDFLRAEAAQLLEPLHALKALSQSEDALPETRGFAFTLLESNGSIERRAHLQTVRNLEQTARQQLREIGVQFGHFNVYLRDMLKPKPARLLSLLVAYGAGGDGHPFIPFAGVTSIPNTGDLSSENYSTNALALAGYKACGPRIARFDILNRLNLLIRQAQKDAPDNAFQIMQEMLAIMGCTYAEMQGVLESLGYKSETRDLPPVEASAAPDPAAENGADQGGNAATAASAPADPEATISGSTVAEPAEQPAETAEAGAPATPVSGDGTVATPVPKKKKHQPKPLNIYHHRDTLEDGTIVERRNAEFWTFAARGKPQRPPGQRGRNAQKTQGKSFKKNKFGNKRPADKGGYKPKPQRERKVEDSPFAALAKWKQDREE